MSEPKKAGATSGQKVPKSPKSKFRAKSQQEQTAESKLRMEKRGGLWVTPYTAMCMRKSTRWNMKM